MKIRGNRPAQGEQGVILNCKSISELPQTQAKSKSMSSKRAHAETNTAAYNKMFKLDDVEESGRFLIIERTDNGETMSTVSPFVLHRGVKHIMNGEAREMRKLRNGTVLVRTMNANQAKLLMSATTLVEGINIKVTIHGKLNTSQGVVTCFDLKNASDDEILKELKPQGVIGMKRLKRKNKEGVMEDTDSILFTFNKCSPPETITIGFYQRIRVRLYVPRPLQCFNCQRFGHTAKQCKVEQMCRDCNQLKTEDHKCIKVVCSNCYSIEHASWDKSCPKYKEEAEIQAIKTKYKLPYFDARKKYMNARQPFAESVADVVKKNLARNNIEVIKYRYKKRNDDDSPMEFIDPGAKKKNPEQQGTASLQINVK